VWRCTQRYEKLLDAACAKDENYDAGDDPRRLRPGGARLSRARPFLPTSLGASGSMLTCYSYSCTRYAHYLPTRELCSSRL